MTKYNSSSLLNIEKQKEPCNFSTIDLMVEKFKALIEANGTVEGVDEWGKRRLAYLIDDEAEGYYVIYNFEANTDFPTELERVAKITEGVLRVMTIRK